MSSRILIADDTPTVLDFLELVLDRQGFEVLKASFGEMALEMAIVEQPDLALLDVMMPGVDGFEVCRRLRSDPRTSRLPILLYSAMLGEEGRAQALAAGADDFLAKAIGHTELVARVREWMASRVTPGAIGEPALIDVALDLLGLLDTDLVWLLAGVKAGLKTVAAACVQGEQEARRFLEQIASMRVPLALKHETFLGREALNGRQRFNWPLSELQLQPGGEGLAVALKEMGIRAACLAAVPGMNGETGLLVYAAPAALSGDRRSAALTAIALRYAAIALNEWRITRKPIDRE
jgi:DNA-binding response OmpR family regulator